MRNLIAVAGLALASGAMPSAAHAEGGNGYLEVRGGIAGANGSTTETIGLALGYDFDIGSQAFLGAEVAADTNASFGEPVYGVNARLGMRTGSDSKIFATLGYARARYNSSVLYIGPGLIGVIPVTGSGDDIAAGAGYQQDIGKNLYISLQFQHYFDTRINRASIGFGTKF